MENTTSVNACLISTKNPVL